ncbi:hypothetical protein KGF56_000421 [Candida oxycetoniae]|uniref:Uncharacterized protein n=1 Tax=Candida oxycetoniae TaxID=497107 RepID=A0AAI9T0V9_9ASCO|nr:uncharacterized protein KGF56_000421 [Candida oxycetoniae]KAI3406816.2 hypothetical protein KGF56_000421 [Candida oxycetoniae]
MSKLLGPRTCITGVSHLRRCIYGGVKPFLATSKGIRTTTATTTAQGFSTLSRINRQTATTATTATKAQQSNCQFSNEDKGNVEDSNKLQCNDTIGKKPNFSETLCWIGEELNYDEISPQASFDFFVRDLRTVKEHFGNKPFGEITTGCLIDKLIDVVEENMEDGKLTTINREIFDVYPFIRLINTLPEVWKLHCESTKILDEWSKIEPKINPRETKIRPKRRETDTFKQEFFNPRKNRMKQEQQMG